MEVVIQPMMRDLNQVLIPVKEETLSMIFSKIKEEALISTDNTSSGSYSGKQGYDDKMSPKKEFSYSYKDQNITAHQESSQAKTTKPPEPLLKMSPVNQAQQPLPLQRTMGQSNDFIFTKEIKNSNINYVPYKLLDELYDSLLYVGDMNFSIQVAELLYSKVKVDDEDFINDNACHYYAHKKNMIMVELLESIFLPIIKSRHKFTEYLATVDGIVERVGLKYTQEVLQFTPTGPIDFVKSKIMKSRPNEVRHSPIHIVEGEFVMLISLTQQVHINAGYSVQQGRLMQGHGHNPYGYNQHQKQTEVQQDENASIEVAMIACVREVSKDFVVKLFVLPTKEQSETIAQPGRRWKITKLSNRSTSDKILEALESFTTKISMIKPLLQLMLTPPVCDANSVRQLAESTVQLSLKAHHPYETNLNVSQKKALQQASSQLVTVIQGPPGTGKMITTIEIILEWLRQSSLQILLCAATNITADKLHAELGKVDVSSVRVGPGYENIDLKNKQPLPSFGPRNEGLVKMVRQAQVICTTCNGCVSELLKDASFARIIIVEASQIVETTCLLPIVKGCQQLVLIGDQKCLAPTVVSTWAQSQGMCVSLFERLIKQGVQPQFLKTQYQMHPSLTIFPSYHFYNNTIENGITDQQRAIIYGFMWPNPTIRVAFVNVKGEEKILSSSIQNSK